MNSFYLKYDDKFLPLPSPPSNLQDLKALVKNTCGMQSPLFQYVDEDDCTIVVENQSDYAEAVLYSKERQVILEVLESGNLANSDFIDNVPLVESQIYLNEESPFKQPSCNPFSNFKQPELTKDQATEPTLKIERAQYTEQPTFIEQAIETDKKEHRDMASTTVQVLTSDKDTVSALTSEIGINAARVIDLKDECTDPFSSDNHGICTQTALYEEKGTGREKAIQLHIGSCTDPIDLESSACQSEADNSVKITEPLKQSIRDIIKDEISRAGLNKRPKLIVSRIMHKGVECNSCAESPVIGIRYRCLSCDRFNLCERCEETVEHIHPLLKIKEPVPEPKGLKDSIMKGDSNIHALIEMGFSEEAATKALENSGNDLERALESLLYS
jgi:hypothetical protein